jgi:subtilisin-like proprotein convertase family protein
MTTMKNLILCGALLCGALPAGAALYPFSFVGGAIPDAPNGGLVGVAFQGLVSGLPTGPDEILNVTVSLQISGGYNFDFYVYLVSPNGTLVTLMNQPGSVYSSGSGFDITLSDVAATGIQSAAQTENVAFTGTYQAASSLAAFNGGPANGTWTIFVQDLSPGASGTLDSWGLEISAVPEPVNVALGVFGGGCALAGWLRWRGRRSRR